MEMKVNSWVPGILANRPTVLVPRVKHVHPGQLQAVSGPPVPDSLPSTYHHVVLVGAISRYHAQPPDIEAGVQNHYFGALKKTFGCENHFWASSLGSVGG